MAGVVDEIEATSIARCQTARASVLHALRIGRSVEGCVEARLACRVFERKEIEPRVSASA